MKVMIADDEYFALQGLNLELEQYKDIEVMGLYDNAEVMLRDVQKLSPEVILTDIEMPGINGFQMMERLRTSGSEAKVVFVTAHNHYAVKAFEVNAVDYLIKPVNPERLAKTMDRLRREGSSKHLETNDKKLKIQCFKRFSMRLEDREINTNWRTRKAEELVAFLVCEKGQFVAKDKIAECLWPDLDGEKSLANLYLAYHYIKKQETAMGVTIPIESQRGKMRLQLDQVECDLIQFDLYSQPSKDLHPNKQIEHLEKAVELFQEGLLDENYYSWSNLYQQAYELRLQNILLMLTKHFESLGNFSKSKYYQQKWLLLSL